MLLKAAMDLGMLEIIRRAGLGALLSPSEVAYHLPAHNHPDEKTQVEFANLEKEAGFSSSKVACYAYKL
ncbi:hypothetical protein VitviT2T_001920 [Vitis vinifera]|uniref:Uncharacterized protein n=1 Tax=Vitis vinifera TaxID=29760 RepID=A0ABY9BI42_VITVI|nr:hypothetical protein VitviT2T_001920 [Vitis vinifera]